MIVVDVGNTKTAFAWVENEKMICTWKMSTQWERMKDEYIHFLQTALMQVNQKFSSTTPVLVASVVPAVTKVLENLTEKTFFVSHETPMSFSICIKRPETLGPDRIADSEAVVQMFGSPSISIDMGTATTIGVINEKNEFIGGTIGAGIGTSTAALFSKAAGLSPFAISQPKKALGDDTQTAMESGIAYGHMEMILGLVKRIEKETGILNANKVITGGGLNWVNSICPKEYVQVENLALKGLVYLSKKVEDLHA